MAPNLLGSSAIFLAEATSEKDERMYSRSSPLKQPSNLSQNLSRQLNSDLGKKQYKWNIVWTNVLAFVYLHVTAVYGLYLALFVCQWKTLIFASTTLFFASLGVTAGAHRLWSHKSYKAKLPLRIFLMFFNSVAFQNHIYEWSRDHRVHHKFTDTDADPHNASRGFFFSHIGWLMVKKHRDVKEKGKTIDMSDLEQDGVVMFQKKYYLILMPLCCFVIPTVIPWYFWGEAGWTSWYVATILRFCIQLNGTWLVNSAAHIYGTKPYDKSIGPTQNTFVASIAFGEGWHNYHHVFPWDYKTDEYNDYAMNLTKGFIDMCAKMGLAYDLKTVSDDMIKKRAKRTGDGTRIYDGDFGSKKFVEEDTVEHVWGWGDKDMETEIIQDVKVFNKLTED